MRAAHVEAFRVRHCHGLLPQLRNHAGPLQSNTQKSRRRSTEREGHRVENATMKLGRQAADIRLSLRKAG